MISHDDLLRHLPDAAVCGIYIYNMVEQRNDYINPAYTTITGWTLDDLNSMADGDFIDLFHPDDKEALFAHIAAVTGGAVGEAHNLEYRFKGKDGRWIWCYSKDAAFTADADGKVTAFIGTFVDITSSRLANLVDENKMLSKFANTSSQGFVHTDSDSHMRWCNDGFTRMCGY